MNSNNKIIPKNNSTNKLNKSQEKKFNYKIKNNEENININIDNFKSVNEIILAKGLVSTTKNNRTLSMDLTSSGIKKTNDDLNYKNGNIIINNNGNIKVKTSNNKMTTSLNHNFSQLFKEFAIKKNHRTNSLALYNLTESNSNVNNNFLTNSNNVNYNSTKESINNKKLYDKFPSSSFNKYLNNVNKVKNPNSNQTLNMSLNYTNNNNLNTNTTHLTESIKSKNNFNTSNILNKNKNKSIIKSNSSKKQIEITKLTSQSKSKFSHPNIQNMKEANLALHTSIIQTESKLNTNSRSLNFSKDKNIFPNDFKDLKEFKEFDESLNSSSIIQSPLSNDTKLKLNEIMNLITELINGHSNKNLILKELENIYKYVLKLNSPMISPNDEDLNSNCNSNFRKSNFSSQGSFSNMRSSKRHYSEKDMYLIDSENEFLRKENELLKMKMDGIDKKFDKIVNENSDLREYVKEKTDNYEDLRSVLNSFKVELDEMKNNSKNINKNLSNNFVEKEKVTNSNYKSINNLLSHNTNKNDEELIEVVPVSENEKTGCFADYFNNKKEIDNVTYENIKEASVTDTYDDEEFSVDLDSLNRMNILLESEKEKGYNSVNNNIKSTIRIPPFNINKDNSISNFSNYSANVSQNISPNVSQNINTNKSIFGLNFNNLPKGKDFNDEFMENYNDFSPSWRKEVEKINLHKNSNLKK